MALTIAELLAHLRAASHPLTFADVLASLDAHYHYTPQTFRNGSANDHVLNPAGTNSGSCKVFSFARLHGLNAAQTLACFAEHYQHVLADPHGTDHANIRRFMRYGWAGIQFDGEALHPKVEPAQV